MTEHDRHQPQTAPADAEILAGINERMAGVEKLVPLPPAWQPEEGAEVRGAYGIQARKGFAAAGGLAGLVVVVAILALVLGPALGSRSAAAPSGSVPPSAPTWSTRVTLQIQPTTPGAAVDPSVVDADARIIEQRLNATGVAAFSVAVELPDKIVVGLPAMGSVEEVIRTVTITGKLEFVPLPVADYGNAGSNGVGATVGRYTVTEGQPLPTSPAPLFDGSGLDTSGISPAFDEPSAHWVVNFTLREPAKSRFARYTTTAAVDGEYFAILLDGKVVTAPYVQAPITEGTAQISGNFTQQGAQELATILRSGPLPAPVVIISMEQRPASESPLATVPGNPLPAGSGTTPAPGSIEPLALPSISLASVPQSGLTLGDPSAPVTLDLWLDFQCAACRQFEAGVLPFLLDQYVRSGSVKIVAHDFIVIDGIAGGTESRDAAIAARAAARQGRYWEFALYLMANQHGEASGSFTRQLFDRIALAVGLDVAQFDADYADPTLATDVAESNLQAQAAGMTSVPTVRVQGRAVGDANGVSSAAQIASAVEAALPNARPTAAPTPAPAAPSAPTPAATPTPTPARAASPTP